MAPKELAEFYRRDIQKLIEEINLFKNDDLWETRGSVTNSGGNLALHIIGGLNYLIGSVLANTGYVRNRDAEFSAGPIEKELLISRLQKLIPIVDKTISSLTDEQMDLPYRIFFDKENTSNRYVLTQLLLHLNYHLGQINYLRRCLQQ